MFMLLNFSDIETTTKRMDYISRIVLIFPLGVCTEIVTWHMGLYF